MKKIYVKSVSHEENLIALLERTELYSTRDYCVNNLLKNVIFNPAKGIFLICLSR